MKLVRSVVTFINAQVHGRRSDCSVSGEVSGVSQTHSLKTDPAAFQAAWDGLKRFEFRRNDRDFRVGDWLELHDLGSSRGLDAEILYMLEGPDYGIPQGYAVLSIRILRPQEGTF